MSPNQSRSRMAPTNFTTASTAGASTAGLPAFPGAEGFGATATGGRGGRVIYVTTTAPSGPGSLQWAIDQPGARYILFKVSGLIDTRIHLRNGDVTIAAHTSPGGITIRGFVTDESPYQDQTVKAPADFAQNWILQHIRIRPGQNGPSDDGLRLRYTRNAVVDHVSVGNATDEAVEISYSNNITIQNSLFGETLGSHSFYGGMLLNYSNPAHGFALDNVSIHHNIFTRIEGRLPEASRESRAAAGSTMNLELSSNLYWDPRFFIALGANTGQVTDGRGEPYPIHYRLNAVNNYFQVDSRFPYGMWDDQLLRDQSATSNQLYVKGNKMNLYPSRADYELFYCCNDYAQVTHPDNTSRQAKALSQRHSFPIISYTPALDLARLLPVRVGAWPRDPMDRRLLQPILEQQIAPGSPNINPAGDTLLPPYSGTPPEPPADSDNDGMPDQWERSRGLDPNRAGANDITLSSLGYTNLEVYLHELADSLTRPITNLSISASNAVRLEGQSGSTPFTFTVTRRGDLSVTSSVRWGVFSSGGASTQAARADDFVGGVLPSGTLSFAAGQSTRSISVPVAGDTTVEDDESFVVTLTNPSGAVISTTSATGWIQNDDSVHDRSAPTIRALSVEGVHLLLTFSEAIVTSGLGTHRFLVTVAGSGRTISAVSPGSTSHQLRLTLSGSAPASTHSVRLQYSDLTSGNDAHGVIQDAAGNDLASVAAPGRAADTFLSDTSVDALASSTRNLVLTGSSAIHGTGNNLDNTITGNAAANRLHGAGGKDRLGGAAGNDTLTGGADADIFRFDTAPHSSANRDRITDFNASAGDRIQLENEVFTALSTTGLLGTSAFRIGDRLTTPSQRILYNPATGNLLYDSNGSQLGGWIATFATLTNRPSSLSNTAFLVS
jgi:Ca2+-binding RTX toxin-like protein